MKLRSTPVAIAEGSSINYLLGDHLGSVSTVVDASGQIVSQSRYLPFGELLWEDGASPTDYSYTGQRSLSDIGLMDYNARFYDPMLGRFTSLDSIVPDAGSVIGYNRFAYVNNNPMIYTDPSGHSIECGYLPGTSCANIGPKQKDGGLVYDQGGHTYAATHHTTSEQVAENFDNFFNNTVIVAGVFIEPIDYIVTAKECLSGQCSVLAVAGAVLPFASGSALGRLDDAIDVARVVDKAGDAGRTTDAIADSSNLIKIQPGTGLGFQTFRDLKKYLGSAGQNTHWHHIVEKYQIKMSGFSDTLIHNVDNVLAVDAATHAKISGFYNSTLQGTGMRVRDWLVGQSYEDQYEFGITVLRQFGVIE